MSQNTYEKKFDILKKKYIEESKNYYLILESLKESETNRELILEEIRKLQNKYIDKLDISFDEDEFENLENKVSKKKIVKTDISDSDSSSLE